MLRSRCCASLMVALCIGACGSASRAGSSTDSVAAISGIELPESLRLDTASANTAKLEPVLTPADASADALDWKSDAPEVAKVDASGVVTAVSAGKATITAATHDGKASASTHVYVFALWFHDDFESGTTSNWDLRPPNGPDGAFSFATDHTKVLSYAAGMTGGVLATASDPAWAKVRSGDYYIEARIKPKTNSSTGNKQLYLIARYQDDKNWYGAGLNVQNSTASTQVEIAKLKDGTLARPGQVKAPIVMDTTWYTLRFELKSSMLSVYLDGVLIKSVSDEQWNTGKIGLYTANKSFEIDDVKVGDPKDLPVQLAIDATRWSTEAKSEPKQVHVTAQKPNYEDGSYVKDRYSVVSSAPGVASVTSDGDTATVTPLSAGEATLTFTSAADSLLARTLAVTVEPEFVPPTATYTLTGKTTPAPGEARAYADTNLSISFDAPPTLGATGSVRIFSKSDDTRADVIRLADETDSIGYPGVDGQSPQRYVYTDSRIYVSGNSVVIAPHNHVLSYATEYYVSIADGVLSGKLNGADFRGIGEQAGWSFTTRPEPDSTKTTLTVDDDGEAADFRTVQGALNFVMKNVPGDQPATIQIADGTYQELLFLRAHDQLSLVGESRAGTVIQAKNYEGLNGGSGASQGPGSGSPAGGRALFLVEDSDLLELNTLTLKNTMRRSTSESSQAETIYYNADAGRLIARNADFISEQDTLQLKGYAWFNQTLVAGNVDFIWGANHVALFEDSEIRSIGDSAAADRGFVVQARTVAQSDHGFVFLHSRFTHGAGPAGSDVPTGADAATFLARSSGSASAWDNVVLVDCELGDHVHPLGWAYEVGGQPKSNPAVSSATSGWREYGSHGAGGDTSQRQHGYTLSAMDVANAFSNRAQIFKAFDGGRGWNP